MNKRSQQGVGLIDAMIALAVLVFSMAATGSLLTDSLVAMEITSIHLDIDSFAEEMSGIIHADTAAAKSGAFNVLFGASDPVGTWADGLIADWRQRVNDTLRQGDSQIVCTTESCVIQLQWVEYVDGAAETQLYQLNAPI